MFFPRMTVFIEFRSFGYFCGTYTVSEKTVYFPQKDSILWNQINPIHSRYFQRKDRILYERIILSISNVHKLYETVYFEFGNFSIIEDPKLCCRGFCELDRKLLRDDRILSKHPNTITYCRYSSFLVLLNLLIWGSKEILLCKWSSF